ncbi:unnamed protein product [Schistosoma haematobium]|nr:unnamed protein product [Schistosoma haematobium]CAH8570089.1 unnamed protein product [Schistosoma haematobium]
MPTSSSASSKSATASPRGSAGGARQRKAPASSARRPVAPTAQKNPVFLFYSEDSPGIKFLYFFCTSGVNIPAVPEIFTILLIL